MHNQDRAILENMDALPFVTPVYKRDLAIENYFIGYLKHPYISLYTGRGCKSRCTFCLWPQTVGGHRYRTRSVEHVDRGDPPGRKTAFPQVKEFFFDDDTFTDDLPRAEAIARELGKLGVTWSCNAKANVPRETLEGACATTACGCCWSATRSGNQQILHNIKKGMRVDVARRFTKDCHELGITIHGTFILGLPGETQETIEETIRFATEINPHTIQVSLAAPYPGTYLYRQALRERLARRRQCRAGRRQGRADRAAALSASQPHRRSSTRSRTSIAASISARRRSPRSSARWCASPQMMKRRLREGVEFFQFLRERREAVAKCDAVEWLIPLTRRLR